jgi:DNA-binding MarR family transcriptional regulator
MTTRKSIATAMPDVTLQDVYGAPGHLIRRCNQISVALFFEEMKQTRLTPVQYASLVAIHDHPGIEQVTLVDMIAIDRSTIGTVLRGLEARGLISRTTPPHNQRIKQLRILPAGVKLIRQTQTQMARVQERLLAPLTLAERKTFLALLSRVVQVNNEFSRAPLRITPAPSPE